MLSWMVLMNTVRLINMEVDNYLWEGSFPLIANGVISLSMLVSRSVITTTCRMYKSLRKTPIVCGELPKMPWRKVTVMLLLHLFAVNGAHHVTFLELPEFSLL